MRRISLFLTYAGSLPFILLTVCLVAGMRVVPLLGDVSEVLSLYALVIASFMTGAHWGQQLSLESKLGITLAILSNVNAVFLWLSFLVFPLNILLYLMSVSFVFLLLLDERLFRHDVISRQYFFVRCVVTCVVVSTLITSGGYV